MTRVDLDAYFRRIGYFGGQTPSLATLNALCDAHVRSIPFENLDVLLGRGISLREDAVDRKLIVERRGGYCFEQNTLLLRVLTELGFRVSPLSARVRIQRPRDFTPPRTHVFLRVELDEESWLVDVGVGGLSLSAAIRLVADVEQETPHESRRLLREAGRWFHQAKLGYEWADVYEFTLEEMPAIDREVSNWFTSTHPQSHFKDRLMVARARSDGGRVTLLNPELTLRSREGASSRIVASPDELLAVLASEFELQFPAGTRFPCSGLDWSWSAGA